MNRKYLLDSGRGGISFYFDILSKFHDNRGYILGIQRNQSRGLGEDKG